MNAPGRARLMAIVDGAAGAVGVLDAGCVLAQLLRLELQLVFVEDAAVLAAAELSVTRVLAQGSRTWMPFAAVDVERGWRAQAARMRALLVQAAEPRAVHWSLRVTRGCVRDTALALLAEPDADLLLLAGPSPAAARPGGPARRRRITVLDDGSSGGRQALEIAGRLADVLAARLDVRPARSPATDPAHAASADLLVLPRDLIVPPMLAALRVPALLVGRARAEAPAGSIQGLHRVLRRGGTARNAAACARSIRAARCGPTSEAGALRMDDHREHLEHGAAAARRPLNGTAAESAARRPRTVRRPGRASSAAPATGSRARRRGSGCRRRAR